MGILVISLFNIFFDFPQIRALALLLKLQKAASGPGFHAGGEENFQLRLWQHSGPDIPAVHNHILRSPQFLLELHQLFPHPGMNADRGSQHPCLFRPHPAGDIFPVEKNLLFPSLMMSAYYVIMMRTYFTTNIPDAVIEAARIDGAGELRILIRVVLPMSIPIIATLALLVGLAYWNDWLNGLYYISDDRLFSIQVLLNRMLLDVQFLMSNSDAAKSLQQNEEFVLPSTGIRMAVAVMGALPILVVYPFFQKYFVKGIVIGAVKG